MAIGEFFEGTPASLCAVVFSYLIVASLAFNAAGGLTYATGAYVLFNAVLSAVLGLTVKLFLGEPVQSNLQDAQSTMLVYLVGECAILLAVVVSRRMVRSKAILSGLLGPGNTLQIAIGCIILGIGLPAAIFLLKLNSLLSIVAQINNFVVLAILLSVYQTVKNTHGRATFNWPSLVAAVYVTFQGITSASKQALFTPIFAWLMAAAAANYRVTLRRLTFIVSGCFLAVYLLVPYSQYARQFRENGNGPVPLGTALSILSRPLEVRALALQQGEEQIGAIYHWFNHAEGFLDRLNLVSVDDPLIYITNQGQVAGLRNLWLYVPNMIPSIFYPNKPFLYFGNTYAHEVHMIAEDDFGTGISFSPFAEAYHTGRWLGMFLVLPAVLCILFAVTDSVAGKITDSPWSLLYMLVYGHIAAEGALGSPIYVMSEGTIGVLLVAFLTVYVTPLLGGIFVKTRSLRP